MCIIIYNNWSRSGAVSLNWGTFFIGSDIELFRQNLEWLCAAVLCQIGGSISGTKLLRAFEINQRIIQHQPNSWKISSRSVVLLSK